jgi:hypothetical protein
MRKIDFAPKSASWVLATICLAGGTAGAIDLSYATAKTVSGGGLATRPWLGVAGALFGRDVIDQVGTPMALVGVTLHFLITIGAAAIFYAVAVRQRLLVRYAWIAGLAFGVLFFLAMNYVILPLSVIGQPIYNGAETIAYAIAGHVIMIGLPIALITAWRLKRLDRII